MGLQSWNGKLLFMKLYVTVFTIEWFNLLDIHWIQLQIHICTLQYT